MRTPQEEFTEKMKDRAWKSWYHGRPESIQKMIREYPYELYRIKEGAPYAITSPGSIVEILSYKENGMVKVAIRAVDFLPATVEHIRSLAEKHGKDFDTLRNSDHSADVDPRYLVPYEKKPEKEPLGLAVYAIYKDPADFPEKYVVRRWVDLVPDQEALAITETLIEARGALPLGLVKLMPAKDDDPYILETWL